MDTESKSTRPTQKNRENFKMLRSERSSARPGKIARFRPQLRAKKFGDGECLPPARPAASLRTEPAAIPRKRVSAIVIQWARCVDRSLARCVRSRRFRRALARYAARCARASGSCDAARDSPPGELLRTRTASIAHGRAPLAARSSVCRASNTSVKECLSLRLRPKAVF